MMIIDHVESLTTGSVEADGVVAMIVEALARHGLVHVNGEVRLGEWWPCR